MNPVTATRKQRGAVLIVGLIILVVIMIISLTGARNVAFEEKMVANSFDRGLAFQATEAALRAGEAVASSQSTSGNAGFNAAGIYADTDSTCSTSPCASGGLCSQPDKDCAPRWEDSSFSGWTDATGLGLSSLAETPQYFVEYLGGNFPCNGDPTTGPQTCKLYRITARSHDATTTKEHRAVVVLQSVFRTE